ncbi:MAG: biotin--[acetyl-CoA-carboxylase] ligase [Bacteroidaceae bacterium]|nr:biotin--[acetyl-CoA-carboxylase] ligase [Bacteroidaceae bacterium]
MKHFCLDDSPQFHLVELVETTSTNSFLADYQPPREAAVTVVTADFQNAGRGQANNKWESAAGQNLLFSIKIHPHSLPPTKIFVLSEAIALAVRDAVDTALKESDVVGHSVTVKWPNDIYADDKKIAGILIENELQGQTIARAIIGVGLNVNQESFVSDAPNPVSLFQLTGKVHERQFILGHIISVFTSLYECIQRCDYSLVHETYLQYLYRNNGIYEFKDSNGVFEANIIEVKPDGIICLRDTYGNIREYAFKEVEWCLSS